MIPPKTPNQEISPMLIERVQIEEGFLDGLDVTFTRGLNVIIGERGTGKTSLIELIRFCLKVDGYTSESTKRSRDHALSVLGSGQVTVTLSDGESKVLVSRSAADDSHRALTKIARPIILSQTEIETVGLQAYGRLRLLDSFTSVRKEADESASVEMSRVRSLTAEVEVLRREIDELHRQVGEVPALEKLIADLLPKEHDLTKVSADAKDKKDKLDIISTNIAETAVGIGAIERFHQSVLAWQMIISRLLSESPPIEPWPVSAGPDPLENSRESIQYVTDHLKKVKLQIQQATSEAQINLEVLMGTLNNQYFLDALRT
jgi:DNA repair exonuclease SbcCD ATPase subunit